MRMKGDKTKVIGWAATAVFAVAAYCFWAVWHPAMLAFQEQMQMFLTTQAYFTRLLALPGGLATYVAEFLTQFYNNYWVGAVVIAAELVTILLLTRRLQLKVAAQHATAALAVVPAVLVWCQMCDVNAMPAYTVATIGAMALAAVWPRVGGWRSLALVVVAIPLCYWLLGTAVYLFAALMIAAMSRSRLTVKSLLLIGYTMAVIFVTSRWVPYPVGQQFIGLDYCRLGGTVLWLQVAAWAAVVAVSVVRFDTGRYGWVLGIAVVVASVAAIAMSIDKKSYDIIEYDMYVRANDWQRVIAKAESEHPGDPIGVSATNLALAMTGQLDSRAFQFHQHGAEGLVPPLRKETVSALITAEIYFQLGLVNTAQRYYYEALQAVPNGNASVRCVKALAETALLRGDYAVARKYLDILDNTLKYRRWAQRTRQLLDTPADIDVHPVYGPIRRQMLDSDLLFSDVEIDKIIGRLIVANPRNRVAVQYLMLYPLLRGDLDLFVQYYQLVNRRTPYESPVSRQALDIVSGNQQLAPSPLLQYLQNIDK